MERRIDIKAAGKLGVIMRCGILILLIFYCKASFPQTVKVNASSAKDYILSCLKSNGAFGPYDMKYTDVAWTYPAVHALIILGTEIPGPDSCYINGGKSWMEKAKWGNGPWYWSLNQKANLYRLLNRSGDLEEGFRKGIKLTLKFTPRRSYLENKKYTDGNFFDMASLWNLTEAVQIMNGSIENKPEVEAYVIKRQSPNGGFDEMAGAGKDPDNEKAHLIVTHDAVKILNTLGLPVPNPEKVAEWVRSCQTPEGGFRWSPDNGSYSNKPDVWYTWAALRILNLLDEEPESPLACLKWLNSLQNPDGGFGDRPGWDSRLYSTYYAIESVFLLTGNIKKGIWKKSLTAIKDAKIPEGVYSCFTAHHKSPSGGREMVDTVTILKLNLIGIKTTEKEVVESDGMSKVVREARAYAKQKGYKIEIVDCPENYAHRLEWFTGQKADHGSNMLFPPGLSGENWEKYLAAYKNGLKGLPWEEFKNHVIRPVLDIGTLFYPELDYTMLNAYMVYDEGLDGHVGYNAIPAAHFGNYDWVRHFPYKERWLGHLPFIADGDAHGDVYKWRPNLESFRNVFIAKSYHFADYIDASLNGRSVCVLRMPETDELRYYGSKKAVDYLKSHLNVWKWWND